MQGPSAADIVWGTPEALIEQNAFHLQLKLALGQRTQEIANLKEVNVNQKKEYDELKAKYKTLDKTHRCVVPRAIHSKQC